MADEATPEVPQEPETFEVPADLTGLSDEALTELSTKVSSRGVELASRAPESLSDDEVAEAQSLAAVHDEFAAEFTRRAEALAERSDRARDALGRFATSDPEPTDPPEGDDGDTGGDTIELAVDPTPAVTEAAPEPAEGEPVAASAPSAIRKYRGASRAAVAARTSAPAVVASAQGNPFDFRPTEYSVDPSEQRYRTPVELASAMLRRMERGLAPLPAGIRRQELSIAKANKQFGPEVPVLSMDPLNNLKELRGDVEGRALVASGECCSPLSPLVDFYRLAEPIRDLEEAIPSAFTPRGGAQIMQASCVLPEGPVGLWDCTDNANVDPDDPETWKQCGRVECPEFLPVRVGAVTQCVIFDNLTYRTFPELIADFMEDVAVLFQDAKNRKIIDAIDTNSTATTGIGSYGAVRSLLFDWTVAAAGYRRRHHMHPERTLQILIPDWSIDLIRLDLLNDGDLGLNWLNAPTSAILDAIRSRNLDPVFYHTDATATAAGDTLLLPQSVGPLNDFPATVTAYLFAPGTFLRLDGGTLDVGIVRDLDLVRQNDFAMFMEEWLEVVMLGCESIRIDSTVCPDGSRAPFAAALRDCAGVS